MVEDFHISSSSFSFSAFCFSANALLIFIIFIFLLLGYNGSLLKHSMHAEGFILHKEQTLLCNKRKSHRTLTFPILRWVHLPTCNGCSTRNPQPPSNTEGNSRRKFRHNQTVRDEGEQTQDAPPRFFSQDKSSYIPPSFR